MKLFKADVQKTRVRFLLAIFLSLLTLWARGSFFWDMVDQLGWPIAVVGIGFTLICLTSALLYVFVWAEDLLRWLYRLIQRAWHW